MAEPALNPREDCGREMIIGKDGQITELPRIISLTDPMENE